jgi:LysM repeat protein
MLIINRSVWLTLMLIVMLTLAACERPYPRPEPAEAPAQDPLATQPIVPQMTPLTTPISTPLTILTLEPDQPAVEIVSTAEPPSETIHTVQAGETLFEIASQYGVTIEVITSVNNIPNINQLEVGQQLIIPGPGYVIPTATEVPAEITPFPGEVPTDSAQTSDGTHVVQAGENLYRIGLRYGCTTAQMAAHNGITNPNVISVGQVLNVPDCN